ncbi:hypothetical protein VTL71DRAFT_4988 [Oculimacula yallundae]|uniref:Thioesterase domain-containing protein n=1 Tax=Oculimacula yallundae TaxID=86028 RepID=A0ABR4C3K6_9HELO
MAPWDILFAVQEKDLVARVQAFIDGYKNHPEYQGFDASLMRALKVESATISRADNSLTPIAKTTFSVLVSPNLQNPRGFMHGGAQALLVDMCTTMAVAPLSSKDFWHFGGLTRTLNVVCLQPVPGNEVVYVDCEVRGIGKRLAHITCALRNAKGDVLALGEHGKAAIPLAQKYPTQITESRVRSEAHNHGRILKGSTRKRGNCGKSKRPEAENVDDPATKLVLF